MDVTPLAPLPREDVLKWVVWRDDTDEVVATFYSAWAAEDFLDDLVLEDPELHAVCVIKEHDPNGDDDRHWTAEQIAEALR